MTERNYDKLTLHEAQTTQPWTVPYSIGFMDATNNSVRHAMSSHAVLHAMKTVGQLAAVFENLDHTGRDISPAQLAEVEGKSADLVTAAMRLANLQEFDLARALIERSEEKNDVTLHWAGE